MDWKKFLSYKHHNLSAHHHYQMAVIFLFICGFFLFFPFYIFIETYKLDISEWQWYFFIPWMIFYIAYCFKQRGKIGPGERIEPMKRPIMHWILLGITLLAMSLQPNDLEKMSSLNFSFIIFSMFVADGYWDFKKYD